MVIGLDRTLRALGGVPTYGLTDNEKTVTVEHVCGIAVRNPTIVEVSRHYGLTIATCEPGDPQSKGGSENTVKLAQADLVPTWHNLREEYEDWPALERACLEFMADVNTRAHRATRQPPVVLLGEEHEHLHRLPRVPHTLCFGQQRKVDRQSTVSLGEAIYSVPHELIGEPVWVRAEAEQLIVVHVDELQGPREVARHALTTPGRPSIKDEHYPPRPAGALERKVRARSEEEREFLAIGPGAERWLRRAAAEGAQRIRRKMAEAVDLAKLHGSQHVSDALERCAAYGRFGEGDLASGHAVLGLGGHGHEALFNHWLYDAVIGVSALVCLWRARAIRADRGAWVAIGLAIVVYWLGDLYWNVFLSGLASPPYPSWADAGWLGYYLPLYVGLILLIRGRVAGAPVSMWLEGLVGALALGSVGAIVVFDPVVASTHGSFSTVATNLAYPVADVLLLVIIAAGLALQRQSVGASWVLLGTGLVLFGLGDSLYLLQSARGTYSEGGWINATWPLAMTLTATAAWAPEAAIRTSPHAHGRRISDALNGGFALLVIGVMLLESVRRVPVVAHLLVVGAVVAVLGRVVISGRERVLLERTAHEARTDDLTGLPNRRHLYEATERTLAAGPAALLLLDLNHFKEINDTLGHNSGDDVLRQVAHRLAATLPAGGQLARLGGDEFVALLDDRHTEHSAMHTAARMRDALERPFAIQGFCAPMPASIGVALAPAHAHTRAELLRCADVAMYRAKTRETSIELYLAHSDANTRHRLQLVSELRAAVETDQLVLHYQPKLTLPDRRLAGVEVLARWNHPRLGLLGPDEFISLAEQHGLMRILTLTVLDRALAQQRLWHDAGREIPIAVNLSPVNLLDTRLPDDVLTLLDRHRMPPTMLQLEITENTLMRDPDRALDVLASLSEHGITFALDDFGTGYSSLAQLKNRTY